ncbi:metal-dependent transcriptional regulator [Clostridium polyendosporum]|nr:hypothetical protein [Clostridium polyendosporum]
MRCLKKDREFHKVLGYQVLNVENKLLTLSMEEEYVRINQLVDKLNVRPSSTTKVVKKLNELGLVDYQRYGIIQLMGEGKSIGDFLLKR